MTMVMPFGKWAGYDLAELPDDYIRWALDTLTNMEPPLRRALTDERRRRGLAGAGSERLTPAPNLPVAVSVDLALELVKAGRRVLASQYHPDRRCGDAERMVQANATADYLQRHLPQMLTGRG